jgi:hypothetical protein
MRRSTLVMSIAVVTLVLAVGLIAAAPGPTQAEPRSVGSAASPTDFNGDGYADLAIAASDEDVGTVQGAGGVNVLYGSAGGLQAEAPDDQFWTQDSPGVRDMAEAGDSFGAGLAAGDFDGNGFTDLAIGAHFEDVGTIANAGAVNVLYGSANGLTSVDQFWTQDTAAVLDEAESGDMFGASLAAADFDGDGFVDLAVGVREEDVGAANSAGAVNVLYGSASGLTSAGNQFWTQDGLAGEGAETGDVFSRGLGAGDFDGDGFADLAVGAWEEDVGSILNAGAVNVIYGSLTGLTENGNQYWTQDSPDVLEEAETNDWFGRPVTAGDFNADGLDDLAIGAHRDGVGSAQAAGVLNVLFGSPGGLTAAGSQLWSQDSPGVKDVAEAGDHFARTASAGDFNGDGFGDLAVGVSEEAVGVVGAAGAVNVLYGSPAGLTAQANQFWTQNSPGILDGAEADDLFGWYVKAGDFNGDGPADLASTAAYEDLNPGADAGAVHVLYGSPAGVATAGNQFWTQNSTGVRDRTEAGDLFGVILA